MSFFEIAKLWLKEYEPKTYRDPALTAQWIDSAPIEMRQRIIQWATKRACKRSTPYLSGN